MARRRWCSALIEQKARRGELAAASEFAGRGDIDRLLTEWRSLLRLVVNAPAWRVCTPGPRLRERRCSPSAGMIFARLCRTQLGANKADALPDLPPLTPEQRRPVNHRFFKAPALAARLAIRAAFGPGGGRRGVRHF